MLFDQNVHVVKVFRKKSDQHSDFVVVFLLQFAITPFNSYLMLLQFGLDALAVFDQYISAHVAYSNEKGVEVTHPFCTAVHYLKTSFALDFLSWLPADLIFLGIVGLPKSVQQWRLVALLRLNRLLQLNKVSQIVLLVFSYFLFVL